MNFPNVWCEKHEHNSQYLICDRCRVARQLNAFKEHQDGTCGGHGVCLYEHLQGLCGGSIDARYCLYCYQFQQADQRRAPRI